MPRCKRWRRFAFPGNVRQLENICHWLTVMAPGQRIDVADLPPEVRERNGPDGERDGSATGSRRSIASSRRRCERGERNVGERLEREFERTLIRRALAHTGGHRMEAAAWLGWGRNTLTRKIQELGMDDGAAQGRRACACRACRRGIVVGRLSVANVAPRVNARGYGR